MKTIHTILPVYDRLDKQDYRRTRNALPVHCPRYRLPAMQWNVETDNPGAITDIDLINFKTGAAVDIYSYFLENTTLVTGWTNTAHPNDYDTFTLEVDTKNIDSAVKTLAAGDAIAYSNVISIANGDIILVSYNLTLAGDAPEMVIVNSTGTDISNVETLVNGPNHLMYLIATATDANARMRIRNPAGDTTSYEFAFRADTAPFGDFPKRLMIQLYNLTNDYFQYKGDTLNTLLPYGVYYLKFTTVNGFVYYSEIFAVTDIYPNLITGWPAQASTTYETFTSSGTAITSAIETGAAGVANSINGFNVLLGESIRVIFFHTQTANQAPTLRLYDMGFGDASNLHTVTPGLNDVLLTSTRPTGTLYLVISNTAPSTFTTSEILVMRQYSATHIKLTFDNTKDIGDILYQDGFSQTLWLQTQLAPPQHEQIDIGEEKSGIFIAEKIVNKFKFRILAKVGRELYRAMVRIPLHDDIDIIDEVGNTYSPAVGNIWVNALNWSGFDYVELEILFNDNNEIFWVSNNANFI